VTSSTSLDYPASSLQENPRPSSKMSLSGQATASRRSEAKPRWACGG